MFVLKDHERFRKNQVSVTTSIFFRPSFPSGDKRILEFPTPNLLAELFNLGSSLTTIQTRKYNKNDFQQIPRTISKTQLLQACG